MSSYSPKRDGIKLIIGALPPIAMMTLDEAGNMMGVAATGVGMRVFVKAIRSPHPKQTHAACIRIGNSGEDVIMKIGTQQLAVKWRDEMIAGIQENTEMAKRPRLYAPSPSNYADSENDVIHMPAEPGTVDHGFEEDVFIIEPEKNTGGSEAYDIDTGYPQPEERVYAAATGYTDRRPYLQEEEESAPEDRLPSLNRQRAKQPAEVEKSMRLPAFLKSKTWKISAIAGCSVIFLFGVFIAFGHRGTPEQQYSQYTAPSIPVTEQPSAPMPANPMGEAAGQTIQAAAVGTDPWGIPIIPSTDIWANNPNGNIRLPLPGGIHSTSEMALLGFKS